MMPKCWAAQPSHTTNGTNSIPWSGQETGFRSWADIGESPRKFRCLAEDQVTERTITLIAFNPEFLQRSTSHKWHIRSRRDTVQCTGCKFPTQQPSCHYLLYFLPATASSTGSFYTIFLMVTRWEHLGVFFSFKDLYPLSIACRPG